MKTRLLFCLIALSACSTVMPKYHYDEKPATLKLTLLPHDTLAAGKTIDVDAKLTSIKNLSLLTDNDFDTVHTQKIHLLIADPTLTDYQHVHPQPTSLPGVYHFQFTPKLAGGYRVWADVTPSATHKQEFVSADLGPHKASAIARTPSQEADVSGYHFTLTFDTPPTEGAESVGTVHVSGKAGLQPLMGAYGHIVGFYDDFRAIVHTHPMGEEPKNDSELGGPDVRFHLMAVKPGFLKLFAQFKIDGREVFVPFGVNVAAQDAK